MHHIKALLAKMIIRTVYALNLRHVFRALYAIDNNFPSRLTNFRNSPLQNMRLDNEIGFPIKSDLHLSLEFVLDVSLNVFICFFKVTVNESVVDES